MKEHYFDDIDDMHDFIIKCYHDCIKYSYFRKRDNEKYKVVTFDEGE